MAQRFLLFSRLVISAVRGRASLEWGSWSFSLHRVLVRACFFKVTWSFANIVSKLNILTGMEESRPWPTPFNPVTVSAEAGGLVYTEEFPDQTGLHS